MSVINRHQKAFKEQIEKEKIPLGKRPDWLKVKLPTGDNYSDVRNLMREKKLNTVCEEAKCPNIAECWNHRTATFMILGDTCTRSCGFCNVKLGLPTELDLDEPRRVVDAIKQLNLRHAVITSVNRDELEDGGSAIFKGEAGSRFAGKSRGLKTKSGIMVGIGEKTEEVLDLMKDLYDHGCEIMTIGQYLQPTKVHLPVDRFVTPEEFRMYKEEGLKMGFKIVESSPLVRSSYHAHEHAKVS
ncbi:MAG: lipoyl synthase [bacterium]|nr:lipoyl synthase [bacterium]